MKIMGVFEKKLLKVLVCLVTAFSIAGCSKGSSSSSRNSSNKSSSETQSTETNTQAVRSTEFTTEYEIEYAKDGYFVASKLDGKLFGLLDSTGKTAIPFEYDAINFPESINAKSVIVEKEGKKGILDYTGKEILPIEYSDIYDDNTYSNEYEITFRENNTRYLVTKNGVQSIVNLQGKTEKTLKGTYQALIGNALLAKQITSYGYGQIYTFSESEITTPSYHFVKETGINGIVDFTKHTEVDSDAGYIVTSALEAITGYLVDKDGNYQEIKCDDRHGDLIYLGNDNLLSLECTHQGLNVGSVDALGYRLVNVQNRSVSETKYNEIRGNGSGANALYKDSSGKYVVDIYNSAGQITKKLTYDDAGLYGPWIVVEAGDTQRLYNKEGKQPTDQRYLDVYKIKRTNLLLLENLDGQWGIMGTSGDMLAEFGKVDENLQKDLENDTGSYEVYEFGSSACVVEKSSSGDHVTIYAK